MIHTKRNLASFREKKKLTLLSNKNTNCKFQKKRGSISQQIEQHLFDDDSTPLTFSFSFSFMCTPLLQHTYIHIYIYIYILVDVNTNTLKKERRKEGKKERRKEGKKERRKEGK